MLGRIGDIQVSEHVPTGHPACFSLRGRRFRLLKLWGSDTLTPIFYGLAGAPLLSAADGTLIGLHSSWDDQTAMRHGIPFVAVKEFLQKEVPEALKRLMSIDLGEDERGFDEA